MQRGGCSFKNMPNRFPPCQRDSASTDNAASKTLWPLAVSGEVKCCLDVACQLKSMGPAEPAKALLQQLVSVPRATGTDAARELVARSSACWCTGCAWVSTPCTLAWEGAAATM